MKCIPVSRARLGDSFDAVVDSRQPVRLTSHNSSAVVVGWEEWHAIEESLHRLSAPALRPAPRDRRGQDRVHVRS